MKNNKLLCFTTSYRRPYHLYHTINSILNQTYKNLHYVVGICIDDEQDKDLYSELLSDYLQDDRLNIFFHRNLSQHDNYLYPILQVDYHRYDLFAKIDDDDIYKSKYLEYTIGIFKQNNIDIISSNIVYQINNNKIYRGLFDNVGGYWSGDVGSNTKFGMPFSYIFNHKCLDILLNTSTEELRLIHPFEDPGWRTKWREAGINSFVIPDSNLAIYHIHGKNISSSAWLIEDNDIRYIDNHTFTICLFKHTYWQSYIILNKTNQNVYNIQNHDTGSYRTDNDNIIIKWDKYTQPETFTKKITKDQAFTYEYII